VAGWILHGIEAPNLIHTNTLSENLADIQEKAGRELAEEMRCRLYSVCNDE